jgi:hypothetical protein
MACSRSPLGERPPQAGDLDLLGLHDARGGKGDAAVPRPPDGEAGRHLVVMAERMVRQELAGSPERLRIEVHLEVLGDRPVPEGLLRAAQPGLRQGEPGDGVERPGGLPEQRIGDERAGLLLGRRPLSPVELAVDLLQGIGRPDIFERQGGHRGFTGSGGVGAEAGLRRGESDDKAEGGYYRSHGSPFAALHSSNGWRTPALDTNRGPRETTASPGDTGTGR